jgi:uncharacterized protein (TIGR03435 family)
MRYAKALCTVLCLFTIANPLGVFAQSAAFEVALIKPSPDDELPMTVGPNLRNGTLHGKRVTLRMLLAAAYGMTEPRIIGPTWLSGIRFDIVAKSPQGIPDSALEPMLQTLLKDRFKLRVHHTVRKMPVYFLEIGKAGVKMPLYPARDRGPDRPGEQYRGAAMMRGTGTPSQLAERMSNILNRPVLVGTNLTDRYNYFLVFAPLSPQVGDHEPELAQPDIFAAVQEQLGLKLRPARDKIEVVVVDHIEPIPTDN